MDGRVGGGVGWEHGWMMRDVLCSADLSEDLAAAELCDRQRRGVGGLDHAVPAAVDDLAFLLREPTPQNEHDATPACGWSWRSLNGHVCVRGAPGLYCGARAAFALLWSPEGRRVGV